MKWTVRKVVDGELATCASIMASADPWKYLGRGPKDCEASLRSSELVVYVAANEADEILGFLASMRFGIGFDPMIEYICLAPKARNLGIGSGLIQYFEQELFPEARNLYLFVSDINPNAQRLYLRLGYTPAGALSNYNQVGQTEFLFRKTRGPKTDQRDPRISR